MMGIGGECIDFGENVADFHLSPRELMSIDEGKGEAIALKSENC